MIQANVNCWIVVGGTLIATMFSTISPCVADVALFEQSGWRVDGVTNVAPNSIAVSTNGVVLGQFTELKIFFDVGTNDFALVFSVHGNGTLRPSLPPPGVFGAASRLLGYWDCDSNSFVEMKIVALDIGTEIKNRTESLSLTGMISNNTSLEANDFSLLFPPPESDSVQAKVSYKLKATRDFCVDKNHQDLAEGFQVARLTANYLSNDVHDVDMARYIGVTDRICYYYGGCFVTSKRYCATLSNEAGYLFGNSHRMATDNIFLINTDGQPAESPTLQIDFRKPRPDRLKVQGLITTTGDADANNVAFWGNWTQPKRQYRNGKNVGSFQYTIKAIPPGPKDCSD
jgi:hypothetical protein